MYLGKIVELSPAEELYEKPIHPYTSALLGSIPIPDPRENRARDAHQDRRRAAEPDLAAARLPLPHALPRASDICRTVEPPLTEYAGGHLAACHFPQNVTAEEISASDAVRRRARRPPATKAAGVARQRPRRAAIGARAGREPKLRGRALSAKGSEPQMRSVLPMRRPRLRSPTSDHVASDREERGMHPQFSEFLATSRARGTYPKRAQRPAPQRAPANTGFSPGSGDTWCMTSRLTSNPLRRPGRRAFGATARRPGGQRRPLGPRPARRGFGRR